MKTQREIKFRCWNKPTQQMHYLPSFPEILYHTNSIYHDERNWLLKYNIFMQYTGLKDKQGKEIWEGDIVKFTLNDLNENKHPTEIKEVKWNPEYGWGLLRLSEIIGNIYENKELLQKQKNETKKTK